MRTLFALTAILLLAGCASAPRPQLMVAPHHAPIVKAAPAPAVAAPDRPATTFRERYITFKKKHPIKWTH
jgi:hypothetical protein